MYVAPFSLICVTQRRKRAEKVIYRRENTEFKQTATATATRPPPNKRYREKKTLSGQVRFKPSSAKYQREMTKLIFRICVWK